MVKLNAICWLVCTSLLGACADVDVSSPEVGLASQALSPCDETVPANRNVDGIPAYAQCAASENSAVFSNDGVETSLTQQGSDWVRTQYSGGYQCTEFAHRYLHFKWKVKWIPNGNAGNWCDTQPPASSGVVQTTTPVHGDIMVLAAGSCGAGTPTGHVNIVDTVDAAGASLVAVEQNQAGRRKYMQSCGKCFLHVVANNGTPSPAATTAGAAAPATAGAPAAAAGSPGTTTRPSVPTGRAGAAAPAQPPTTPAVGGSAATVPTQPAAAGTAAPAATSSTTNPLSAAGSAAPTVSPTAERPRAPAPESGCSVTPTRFSSSTRHGHPVLMWLAVLGLLVTARRRR